MELGLLLIFIMYVKSVYIEEWYYKIQTKNVINLLLRQYLFTVKFNFPIEYCDSLYCWRYHPVPPTRVSLNASSCVPNQLPSATTTGISAVTSRAITATTAKKPGNKITQIKYV